MVTQPNFETQRGLKDASDVAGLWIQIRAQRVSSDRKMQYPEWVVHKNVLLPNMLDFSVSTVYVEENFNTIYTILRK